MWLGWKNGVAITRPFLQNKKKSRKEGVKYKQTTMAKGNYQDN